MSVTNLADLTVPETLNVEYTLGLDGTVNGVCFRHSTPGFSKLSRADLEAQVEEQRRIIVEGLVVTQFLQQQMAMMAHWAERSRDMPLPDTRWEQVSQIRD